jgi:Flp pilus assembly pilin Flp
MNRHSRGPHTESRLRLVAQRGASLIEYMLVLSLIALVTLASVATFGGGVGDSIDDSASRVMTAGSSSSLGG